MSHSHLNSLSSNCSRSMELEIGATHTDQILESWVQCDKSTGYLQDAIVGGGIWCKEQNLLSCSKDKKVDEFPMFSTTAQPFHDCGFTHHKRFFTSNLSSPPQGDTLEAAIKHDPACSSYVYEGKRKKIAYPFKWVKCRGVEGETTLKDINDQILTTPSASKSILHEAAIKHDPVCSSYAHGQRKKIAYPFKLVKSGGVEGETTLKDINDQILTIPSTSKPIPHTVKDSVTNPCKLVRESILSGKEVISFTRIHTRGRGSITVIRTKD